MNMPVLPVHDSFIMHHGYEQELREVVDQAFTEVTGKRPRIDLTKRQIVNSADEPIEPIGLSLEAILKANSWSCYKRFEAFVSI